MPRKPIDYSKSCVYRLIYNNITYYIGSTTNFTNRKNQHKTSCNNINDKSYNYSIYKFIRECEGWDKWDMILIEYYDCKSGDELRKWERHHYDIYKPTLKNNQVPSRNRSEWRENNKTLTQTKKAVIYKNNSEELKKQQTQYRNDNKEKINNRRRELAKQKREILCNNI